MQQYKSPEHVDQKEKNIVHRCKRYDNAAERWTLRRTRLFDMLGRLVYEQPIPMGKLRAEFQVRQLQQGNYILRIKTQETELFRTKINNYQ